MPKILPIRAISPIARLPQNQTRNINPPHIERSYGSFMRTFALPDNAELGRGKLPLGRTFHDKWQGETAPSPRLYSADRL